MSDELKIIQNEDGTFSEYDDTFDITIHCQSEEEQNEVLAKLNAQKPCEDCISREKALQIIRAWFDREATPSDLKNEIEQLPSVTPAPKMGHWIKCIDDNGSSYYLCSACRCGEDFKFDFCPNCGSDNREVEDEIGD